MKASPHGTDPGALPTGTVTFVFTDIEGSTSRWERDRDAMQAAVRKHDAAMRAAIARHGGYVFKTIGDAFCAAFARPEDAVAAMLDAQLALLAEDFAAVEGLRVRAAIHTGTADERDNDYFGPPVNRVARLLGIGHGGQVLISGVTADLVQGALPAHAGLRDLGEHRLRDLARPEPVYQLLAPDLPAEFPPLRSLDLFPNNLPRRLTTFVGREKEIAEISTLVEHHHLVTLVGSGGVGKTRTSLQVAADLLERYRDGVWFVELAPLTSGEYIPSAIAQTQNIPLPADGDPVENLVRALGNKRELLVFDNCEHLVQPAAHVIASILRGAPHVRVLASSRQGLGIEGEQTYRMPSLGTPPESEVEGLRASDAIRSAAVALFVDRARAVDKRFALSDENAPAVADICRRLDGIALAIELAASRVKMLSPRQLRERLDERFRVLTGGSRDLLPRQQTLRALIDWSHDLLDERERTLFRRLGIFVNGFTLDGAVAVGSDEDLDELDVLDVLASLVDKSLVLAEPQGDTLRYRLLESTRAYAVERLAESGERDLLAVRHLGYLRESFARLRELAGRTSRLSELQDALETQLGDVRAALDAGLARPDVLSGGRLLADIGQAFSALGLNREGVARHLAYLEAIPPNEHLLRARLETVLAFLFEDATLATRSLEAATRAVAEARIAGDAPALAYALWMFAVANLRFARLEDAEAALAEAEAIPDSQAAFRVSLLGARAMLSNRRGDLDAAARIYMLQAQEHRSLGNARSEHVAILNVAETEHERGQTARAITIARDLLPAARRGSDRVITATLLCNLAGYLVASEEYSGAVEATREAIALLAPHEPDHPYVAFAIEHIALVDALAGDLARAATLEGYVEASVARLELERQFTETTTHERLVALLRTGLPAEDLAQRTAEGSVLAPERAIGLAIEAPASAP